MKKHIKQRAKTGSLALSIAPLALTGITAIIGLILSSSIVSATNDSVIDQVNITVPVSCTMTGTGMDSHSTEIENGLYENNIGTTTLHAFCNDNEGFAIYAAGYTGNEIGGTNSNKLVGTNASSNATIVSGIATTAGNPDISNWAMKLAVSQDSGDTTGTNAFTIDSAPNVDLPSEAEQSATQASFSQYHVVPNEYVKVAHKNSVTDMTATTGGVKLTTTYAAYISKTQPADTYTGQVIYTLVHPASAVAPGSCNPEGVSIDAIVCMQDIGSANKSAILASMIEEQTYVLKDKRDDKSYTISKLKDGNIWMTQNLDFDIDSSKVYTNLDTDLGWNGTDYSVASWIPASSTKVPTDTTWNSSSVGNTIPESYDTGDLYWNGATWPLDQVSCEAVGGTWRILFQDHGTCDNPVLISSSGSPHYHLGNYYNWTAAVAMNDSSNVADSGYNANQSICPSGWTLPKDGLSSGSFGYLFVQYGLDGTTMNNPYIWENAIMLPLSGGWYGQLSDVGKKGGFWSRITAYEDYSYFARILKSEIDPSYDGARNDGNSVRCVAR